MKMKMYRVAVLVLALCFTFSAMVWAEPAGSSGAGETDVQYLEDMIKLIKEKYKGQVADRQLIEGAVRGMFDTLDPYSTLFNQEEFDQFIAVVDGEYEGVGVMISEYERNIVVSKVLSGSPAEKAGVKSGDLIVMVDGKAVVDSNTTVVSNMLKGKAGTRVKMGLARQGISEVIVVDIERAAIKINPITYEIYKDQIGYIKIEDFNKNTSSYLDPVLQEFDNKKIGKVILDLRDNPGGILAEGVEVAKKFVPEGLIVKVDNMDGPDEEYFSNLKKLKYKTVVLVNGMSASTSEILAGAIQDTNAGTLVGTKTFGKAKVQTIIPLLTPEAYKAAEERLGVKIINAYDLLKYNIKPMQSDVIGYSKLTIAEYLTPKGRMIDGAGITPDVAVESLKDLKVNPGSLQKMEKANKYNLGEENLEIYNVEKILLLAGYDIDSPDFKLDEKTHRAVMQFQEDSGLYPYGTIDFATQDALNKKREELKLTMDKQMEKAMDILSK